MAHWKSHNAERKFEVARKWQKDREAGPVEIFETSNGGARLTLGSITNGGARVSAYIAPKGGLKPKTRYRVSWFAKAEGVSAVSGTHWGAERGFYCVISVGGQVPNVRVPSGASFRGSFGWRHMSAEVVTPEKKSGAITFFVRLLNANGLVEVEDLTVEELGPSTTGR